MSESLPAANAVTTIETLFTKATEGHYGVRVGFRDKERAQRLADRFAPSYVLCEANDWLHLVYLVREGEHERAWSLVDELAAGNDGDAVIEFDVGSIDDDFRLQDGHAVDLIAGAEFHDWSVAEIEEALFSDGSESSADRVTTSIEDAIAARRSFFDAVVTGKPVLGVLDHPFIGSVLSSQKSMKAENRFTNIRGLYRHIAEHPVSPNKIGPGFTACHLADDEETGKPRRKKRNVLSNSGFMFDFDGGQTTDEILEKFDAIGCTYAAYSSYNHLKTPGVHKLRVILPFAEPFVPDDHGDRENYGAAVFRASLDTFAEKQGLELDRNARDITRFMNSPRHPEGGTYFSRIHLGSLYQMDIVFPEERPVSKLAKKAGITLSYDTNGEAYVADGSGVDFFLSLIGDGDDQLGFHDPIYRVLCSYFSPSKEGPNADAGPILRLLRATIEKAVKGPGRDPNDIVRYLSDAYLSTEAENARKFIRETIAGREVEEAAKQNAYVEATALIEATSPDTKTDALADIMKLLTKVSEFDRARSLSVLAKKTGATMKAVQKLYNDTADAQPGAKDAVIQDDVFDVEHVAKEAKAKFASLHNEKRPIIPISEDQQVAVLEYFVRKLAEANAGTEDLAPGHKLFRLGGNAVRIAEDESGRQTIRPLTRAVVKDVASRILRVIEQTDSNSYTNPLIPDWLADQTIVAEDLKLLPLDRFVRHPLFAKDGKLLLETGYDPATKCFIDQTGLDLSNIDPEVPVTEADRDAAIAEIEKVFGDFPYASYLGDDADNGAAGSKAAMYALLLAPLVREVFEGNMPIFAINKPEAGTGATLLFESIYYVWTGEKAPATQWPGGDDGEVRKQATSMLIEASAALFWDNVNSFIGGAVIPTLATGRHRDRRLGGNEMFEGAVRAPIVFAGNGLKMSDEIVRRTVPIYLDAGTVDPTEGRNFSIEDLPGYLEANRSKVLAALITMVRWWAHKGMKPSKHRIASFENFTAIMGGILEANGIDGFLDGRKTFVASMKEEQKGEAGVFQALADNFKLEHGFTTREAFDVLYDDVGVAFTQYEPRFDVLRSGANDQLMSLGRKLGKFKGKVREVKIDGKPIEVRFEAHEVDHKAMWWIVDNAKRKDKPLRK